MNFALEPSLETIRADPGQLGGAGAWRQPARPGPETLSWGPPAAPRLVTEAWEGAREEAYEQKKLRCAWTVTVRPVEAGWGGFVAASTLQVEKKKFLKKEGTRLVAQRERRFLV